MMLATWGRAHPFPGGGNWNQQGGDYLESECLEAKSDKDIDEEKLIYDISDWFTHTLRSRGSNYGFIVISPLEFIVFGDSHSSFAPNVSWSLAR
jgi:hypothetical protein